MDRLSRRSFIHLAALSLASAAAASCALVESTKAPAPDAAPQALPLPTALPAATDTAIAEQPLGRGTTVSITPVSEFFDLAITQRTDWLSAETYVLSVDGEVKAPLKLSLGELKSLPNVEHMRTLECIGNPPGGHMIGNALWRGVRLSDLLWKAGMAPAAVEVKFRCADGYVTSVPVSLATHPESLLAFEMNGEPLPGKHGAPLRALFPGRYGMKQPKWITSIEAISDPILGHWERQGWSNDAIVRVNSQFRTPREGAELAAHSYAVSGLAFTNESGLERVDVSTDGGQTWQEARLLRGPSALAWSEWRYDWSAPTPGLATLIVRATDNDGEQQELSAVRSMQPDSLLEGISTVHRINVTVK